MSRIDTSSLSKFSSALKNMRKGVAIDIAARAAPVITEFAKESFANSEDPYGVPWQPSVDGDTVTLQKTGRLRDKIHYVAHGTILRVKLSVDHAKYQIGKRPVYPRQGGLLPKKYTDALDKIVEEEIEGRILEARR